jgi:Ubiquitin-conjugating enzyme
LRQIDLNKATDSGFSAGLVDESNPFEWQVILTGPPDTLYDGGLFKAKLSFPPDYPFMPPTMRFVSDMWHPNSAFKLAFPWPTSSCVIVSSNGLVTVCQFERNSLVY